MFSNEWVRRNPTLPSFPPPFVFCFMCILVCEELELPLWVPPVSIETVVFILQCVSLCNVLASVEMMRHLGFYLVRARLTFDPALIFIL